MRHSVNRRIITDVVSVGPAADAAADQKPTNRSSLMLRILDDCCIQAIAHIHIYSMLTMCV